jgi:hypothetical protein
MNASFKKLTKGNRRHCISRLCDHRKKGPTHWAPEPFLETSSKTGVVLPQAILRGSAVYPVLMINASGFRSDEGFKPQGSGVTGWKKL